MSNYLCGMCCFKADLDRNQRFKMYSAVNEILTVNAGSGLVLLCSDCDKQLVIVDGKIITQILNYDAPEDVKSDLDQSNEIRVEQFDLFRCGACNRPVTACNCEEFD